MTLNELLDGKQVVAVICNQWGDTGKGKFSAYLGEWADVIARGTGGNNAGHTDVFNGVKRIFHLIPAGITYDSLGKINILGNGMVLDLAVLNEELDVLDSEGLTYNNLMISQDAHVILPNQVALDKRKNQSMDNGGIGSTGKGIGPCYTDKTARKGLRIRQLYNEDVMAAILKNMEVPNIDEVITTLTPYAERIKPFVRDTIHEMHELYRQDKRILIEGAQGLLLSVEFGTYPYVTPSDPSINGTASGVGLSARMVDLPLGIVKFPMMTRVGGGPFPTEFGGIRSEEYCNKDAGEAHKIRFELEKYGIAYTNVGKDDVKYDHHHPNIIHLLNSGDPFERGVGYRLAAEEYGATTKRPRRTGVTDLAALKYAIGINGPNIILTKVDVARGAGEFQLGVGYEQSSHFIADAEESRKLSPMYKHFKGFDDDLSGIDSFDDLPSGLLEAIEFTENFTGANVRILSISPERNGTLIR